MWLLAAAIVEPYFTGLAFQSGPISMVILAAGCDAEYVANRIAA